MATRTTEIQFTKMHGLGNDYIYIDCTRSMVADPAALSVEMSPRHTAVGSDGVILICPSEVADFGMRIFNADGSEARMCGNGSRCVGKYVHDHHLTDKTTLTLETLSGVRRLYLHPDPATGTIGEVTVDMGAPSLRCADIGMRVAAGEHIDTPVDTPQGTVRLTAVSMGNPHGVVFVDNLADLDITAAGPALENHPIWTDRANIEFATVIDPHTIAMRVWERGSGETQACGTGACATAVAAIRTGRAQSPVTVRLPGGDLHISLDPDTGHIMMRGTATEVFTGTYRKKE